MEHELTKRRVVVTGLGLVTLGDKAETLAVRKTFSAHCHKLAFSSTKVYDGASARRCGRNRGRLHRARHPPPEAAPDD